MSAAPTACTRWTARDVVAHPTAGAKERADPLEEKLAGLPEWPTPDAAITRPGDGVLAHVERTEHSVMVLNTPWRFRHR